MLERSKLALCPTIYDVKLRHRTVDSYWQFGLVLVPTSDSAMYLISLRLGRASLLPRGGPPPECGHRLGTWQSAADVEKVCTNDMTGLDQNGGHRPTPAAARDPGDVRMRGFGRRSEVADAWQLGAPAGGALGLED